MRRFTWSVVLLLIASLSVFCVGWLSLRVRPGAVAVVASKTGGVEPEPLRAGRFAWSPAALLPTNLRVVSFSPKPAGRSLSLEGELPSAAAYRAFMAGEPDFSWRLTLALKAAPKPAALPELFSRYGVDSDEALAAWLSAELDSALGDARALVLAHFADEEGAQLLVSGRADDAVRAGLAAKRPLLEILEFGISEARLPDLALYARARELYLGYVERFRASVEPALAEASELAARDQVRMDLLRRYGQLLSEYPSLIDYLAIEAGIAPRPAAPANGIPSTRTGQ